MKEKKLTVKDVLDRNNLIIVPKDLIQMYEKLVKKQREVLDLCNQRQKATDEMLALRQLQIDGFEQLFEKIKEISDQASAQKIGEFTRRYIT